MSLMTEHEFTILNGYLDSEGILYKKEIVRLATVTDEIEDLFARGRVFLNYQGLLALQKCY